VPRSLPRRPQRALVRVEDGSGDGAQLLEVWTPTGLSLELLVDRALDIFTLRYRGQPISWMGPSGLRRRLEHEPTGYGWLRTFHGGLAVTCGLEHFGAPTRRDAAEYAPPDPRTIDLGEHGRISHQAASILRREVVMGEDPALLIVGQVTQAALYAEQFTLRREYRIPLLRPVIELTDTVTNVGPLPTTQVIVYHMNFGYPLVDEDAELEFETGDGPVRSSVGPLGASTPEEVAMPALRPDESGWASARIENPRVGLGVRLDFDASPLPAFFVWTLARHRANALGLNPASVSVPEAASQLAPGATVAYRWRLAVASVQGDLAPPSGI
jgi:Domain of unknown function (DUF4432)